ncbi:MAG: shikimate dehydrogenase [Firmicutes bacterium]|nr:shikimate dehydrogenase [Bacillota bacterium]
MFTEQVKLYGVFGDPVAHSLSPYFQNEAFQLLGINGLYLKFRITAEQLPAALAAVRCLEFGGVNITIPHKEAVIPYLDRLEGDAKLTGSVNTILLRNNELIGYSTDGEGYLLSLHHQAGFNPKGKTVVLLGVGGAARALAFRLVQEEIAALYLVGRDRKKMGRLSQALREKTGFSAKSVLFGTDRLNMIAAQADLVVNTTPLGMYPRTELLPPFPLEECPRDCLISDLVYHPLTTTFLRRAERLKLPTLGGLGMLVYQGILACQIWTGQTPPFSPLYQLLEDLLQQDKQ